MHCEGTVPPARPHVEGQVLHNLRALRVVAEVTRRAVEDRSTQGRRGPRLLPTSVLTTGLHLQTNKKVDLICFDLGIVLCLSC